MTPDYDDIEAKARAVLVFEHAPDRTGMLRVALEAEYRAAMTPQQALAMVAEIRRLRAMARTLNEYTEHTVGCGAFYNCTLDEERCSCGLKLARADLGIKPKLCGAYLGDNDGTCPQLTCIRASSHAGLHDNVSGEDRRIEPPSDNQGENR